MRKSKPELSLIILVIEGLTFGSCDTVFTIKIEVYDINYKLF